MHVINEFASRAGLVELRNELFEISTDSFLISKFFCEDETVKSNLFTEREALIHVKYHIIIPIYFAESVIQFLKRQSPVLSALFSPVDANQLALVEHNSLYVVDIRKPKRSVLNTPLIVSYSFLNNFKLSFVSVIFTI